MALALTEERVVRGYEAIAERPDGSRIAFVPYPTPLYDDDARMIGAVNVLVDVTERRRAEDALRQAAEALVASSAVKDEFLGLVSHELRTPVTTIFGNARLLHDRGARMAGAERQQMVADIATDAERLLGIVENLLLLTRLGSEAPIDSEPHLLDRVVRKAVDSYRSRHTERRIVLHQRARHLIVEADAAYVETVLENLLSNADKYSGANSAIDVSISARDGFGRVVVRDRGIGLDDADLQKLFSPFYRGNSAKAMGNGVGIGLAVCRRLVEALGGELWAHPRRGGGSEFGFSLPLTGTDLPSAGPLNGSRPD